MSQKARLISLFVFSLVLVLTFQVFRFSDAPSAKEKPTSAARNLFVGIEHPSAQAIYRAIPVAKGKPTVLHFHSRYCLDCKKLAPVLADTLQRFPGVLPVSYDVTEDATRQSLAFQTFQPSTVPVLVFITAQGEIVNVLYEAQSAPALESAFNALTSPHKS